MQMITLFQNLIGLIQKKQQTNYGFPQSILSRLQDGPENDNMIVARARPSSNLFTRWIVIYQRRNAGIRDEYFKLRFTVHEFELPNSRSQIDLKDKVNKKTWYLKREDEIYELLARIGVSPANFSLPVNSNYPF
jgi:hypothetical protein